MKVLPAALAAFLSIGTGVALVTPKTFQLNSRQNGSLFSLAPPAPSERSAGGRSEDEIRTELSSGRVLEGGKVIDFEAIKGPSMAEQALLEAKTAILQSGENYTPNTSSGILGINADVIAEVGHELGTFASASDVQRCAAYLRSLAPPGFFESRSVPGSHQVTGFTTAEKAEFDELLCKAYFESGEVTGAFAKTFFMGTQLLPVAPRGAIWAIYVWCRRTDEIVDAPRDSNSEMLKDLGSWEMRLENLWKYGEVEDVFDLCLLDVLVKYPNLPITPFMDMIRGMLMDVPGIGQDRYDTFDELHLYCYRVAGTVGLMSLPVFGCAEGYDDVIAKEPALSLGVAFQLTNILRDVGEDARDRGRVYLPQEDLRRFGVTEEQLFAHRVDDNYKKMMQFQISRARMYYERARRGVFMLAPESRLPVQSSLDAYGRILDKIEENGYDSLTTRAYVDKWEKLSIIPFSWYRTLDISRLLPLPGDKAIPRLDEAH